MKALLLSCLACIAGGCAPAPRPLVAAEALPPEEPEVVLAPAQVEVETEPAPEVGTEMVEAESDGDDLAAQALEPCNAAAALLESGDTSEAVQRIDECYALMLALPEDGEYPQVKQDIRVLVARLISRLHPQAVASTSAARASWDLGLPMFDNEHVAREIKSFTSVERQHLVEGYRRSFPFRPMILAKLEAAGLPSQISWLPLVESSFKTGALSRAGALGLWQFIASTGLRYGLKRDAFVDERLDPEKATDAAISYLIDLHGMFGDWPKALAAYNCGEGRVQRLQAKEGKGYLDFWDLYMELPNETRRYFPRLLAVLRILEDPARYGVELPEPDHEELEVAKVQVERPVRLEDLDKALGLGAGTLSFLNPALRNRSTPKGAYDLTVPKSAAALLPEVLAKVPVFVPREPEIIVHRVRSGETLSVIARNYRSSITAIMRLNGLRSANRIWPGQRLKIPARR